MRFPSRPYALCGALLALACVLGPAALAQEAGEGEQTGTVVGHVEVPDNLGRVEFVQAVLLSPEWAADWNRETQRRIDDYWNRNIAAIGRDPDLFRMMSRQAQREATMDIVVRMQGRLGPEGYREVVKEVDPDGGFAFENVPFGLYRVVVVAGIGDTGMIWSDSVAIRSPSPEFVEMQNQIQ